MPLVYYQCFHDKHMFLVVKEISQETFLLRTQNIFYY